MCKNPHRDKHDQKVEKDGCVCQDAKLLQSPNLTNYKASNCPDQTAYGIAKFELADLRKRLAIADDNDTDGYQKLKALQKVDNVSQWTTPSTERKVTVILRGELVRIDAEEYSPQEPT